MLRRRLLCCDGLSEAVGRAGIHGSQCAKPMWMALWSVRCERLLCEPPGFQSAPGVVPGPPVQPEPLQPRCVGQELPGCASGQGTRLCVAEADALGGQRGLTSDEPFSATARGSNRGPASRAWCAKTGVLRRRCTQPRRRMLAIRLWTSAGNSAAAPRTGARPIRRVG